MNADEKEKRSEDQTPQHSNFEKLKTVKLRRFLENTMIWDEKGKA